MYRWSRNEECRNHRKHMEPKRLLNDRIPSHYNDILDRNILPNENAVNGDDEPLEMIKTKLLTCDSITSLYSEIKVAIDEIEKHIEQNNIEFSDTVKASGDSGLSDGFNGIDEHTDVRIELENNQLHAIEQNHGICDNNKLVNILCDSFTQTESLIDTKFEEKVEPNVPIPPPPPLPNLFTTTCNMDYQSQSKTDCNPIANVQKPNESNIPIPPPPPFPSNSQPAAILSSASSFCSPPVPSQGNIPCPPPLPFPSSNLWFKSDSKISI